jgi:serine/threonine protein kinase
VAIKEYFPSDFAKRAHESTQLSVFSGDAGTYFRRGLANFLDEARRLAAFVRQGSIVAVHDTFEANNTAYIVMEYLEGKTLKELLKEKGRLDFDKAMSIITPVLDALVAVHSAGIIHRDVAPDNIFIRTNGTVTLIDFGAARAFAKDANKSMTVVLKPGYAPIEQYLSKGSQGPWTDVYAAAATLYRMLTGTVPEESMQRALKDDLALPSELGVTMPPVAETALMAALAVEPEQRIRDVATLRRGLSSRSPKVARQPAPATAATKPASASVPSQPYKYKPSANPPAQQSVDPQEKPASGGLGCVVLLLIAGVFLMLPFLASLVVQGSTSTPLIGSGTVATNNPVELSSIKRVGERVEFGTWDGKSITWQVLAIENGRALVISEYVLERRPYNEEWADITWETCTLRQYLNGEFLQANFSADEQSRIGTVTNQNPDNPKYETDGGNPTEDRVFLLSIDEANKYFAEDSDRATSDLQGEARWWWLRSPGNNGLNAVYVTGDGVVRVVGGGVSYYDGVRPALWLNL